MVSAPPLHVAVDSGWRQHRVAMGSSAAPVLEEFDITHDGAGCRPFLRRSAHHERRLALPVVIAMEGDNHWARPLDTPVRRHGYRRYNVNNLKRARFKEIFPAPAKTDAIATCKMLALLKRRHPVPLAIS